MALLPILLYSPSPFPFGSRYDFSFSAYCLAAGEEHGEVLHQEMGSRGRQLPEDIREAYEAIPCPGQEAEG